MDKWYKKNDLRKGRKYCPNFRFISDINSEEQELGKENDGKHEASFLALHIIIRNEKFKVGLYSKRDSFIIKNCWSNYQSWFILNNN